MGFSISAIKGIVGNTEPDDFSVDDYVKQFPEHCGKYIEHDFIDFSYIAGYYETPKLNSNSYNTWRNELAKLMGHPKGENEIATREYLINIYAQDMEYDFHARRQAGDPTAFMELFLFSDCSGLICEEMVKYIDADFKQYAHICKDANKWFVDDYEQIAKVFAVAAENDGCVIFV